MLLRVSNKEAAESGKEASGSIAPASSSQRLLWCHCYHHCPEDSTNNTCRCSHLHKHWYSHPLPIWILKSEVIAIWVCVGCEHHMYLWLFTASVGDNLLSNIVLVVALCTEAKPCFTGRMAIVLLWWRRREAYRSRLQVALAWWDQSFSAEWVNGTSQCTYFLASLV